MTNDERNNEIKRLENVRNVERGKSPVNDTAVKWLDYTIARLYGELLTENENKRGGWLRE